MIRIVSSAIVLLLCIRVMALQAPNGETYENTPFFDDFDGASVDNSAWQVATWSEHGGQTGKDRCFVKDGLLHMHFINSSTDGYLSASNGWCGLQNAKNLRLKTRPAPRLVPPNLSSEGASSKSEEGSAFKPWHFYY